MRLGKKFSTSLIYNQLQLHYQPFVFVGVSLACARRTQFIDPMARHMAIGGMPPTSLKKAVGTDDSAVQDIASKLTPAKDRRLPASKILPALTSSTKQIIAKSGKGFEGFVKQFPDMFQLDGKPGAQRVITLLKDPSDTVEPLNIPVDDAVKEFHLYPPPDIANNRIPNVDPDVSQVKVGDITHRMRLFSMMEPGKYYSAESLFQALNEETGNSKFHAFEKYLVASSPMHFYLQESKPGASQPQAAVETKTFWVAKRRYFDEISAPPPFTPAVLNPILASANRFTKTRWASDDPCRPTDVQIASMLAFTPDKPFHFQVWCRLVPPKFFDKFVLFRDKLSWFSCQPRYFDFSTKIDRMGNVAILICRCPMLEPQAADMDSFAAAKHVLARIDDDKRRGYKVPAHLALLKEQLLQGDKPAMHIKALRENATRR